MGQKYKMVRKFSKFNIYSDTKEALGIIDLWNNFHEEKSEEKLYDSLHRWIRIPKEIRDNVGDKVPFWLSSSLRKEFPEGMQKHNVGEKEYFVGIEEKNIAYARFPEEAWDDRELYEECCDDFYIYGKNNRQEIWDAHIATVERLKKPLKKEKQKKKKLDTDYTMKEEYGWLSRDGTYFPCGFALHDKFAKQICINQDWDTTDPTQTLEGKGWVRIHRIELEPTLYFSHTSILSDDQQKKIDRYCAVHDVTYQNSL